MIRVKPNSCGYQGYRCAGIPVLPAAHSMPYGMVYDDRQSAYDSDAGQMVSRIDNYLNIPTKIRGFVMTVSPIQDMSNVDAAAVAEIQCIAALDAGSTFLDLYNHYADSAHSAATSVIVSSTEDSSDSQPSWTVVHSTNGYRHFAEYVNQALTDSIMDPGPLEPMLNVDFNPIGLDTVPSPGPTIDGLLISIIGIMKWRQLINYLINYLLHRQSTNPVPFFNGLLKENPCSHFKIVANGDVVKRSDNSPSFSVVNVPGSIAINGASVPVQKQDISSFRVSSTTYVYLEVQFSGSKGGSNGQYTKTRAVLKRSTSSPSTGGSQKAVISIGAVRRIKVGGYYMWQINQERCEVDEDIVRTHKGGVLKRSSGASPYEALDTGECDESGSTEGDLQL